MTYSNGAAEWAEIMDPRDAVEPKSVLDHSDQPNVAAHHYANVGFRPEFDLGPNVIRQDGPAKVQEPSLVGRIFSTSWGYDQTNVEFFEAVRETKSSVWLRRIKAEVRDGRLYPRPGEYTTDFHLMGNPGTPTRLRDEARGYSEKQCRKRPGYRGGYWLRIDEVRSASEYTGGGAYDTIAAGHPGH